MNSIPPSGRPTPLRRWFLSLLNTRPARRLLHHALLATLTLQLAAPSWAGEDFQVNTYTTDYQRYPSIAVDSDGDFVVVWESVRSSTGDTSAESIQAQRYNSVGMPLGSQFQVNSYTTSSQDVPAVAMDNEGNFVVVWESTGSSGSDNDWDSIQGQRYNSAGIPQDTQFQVNTVVTGFQFQSVVAMDNDGDFVVVWVSAISNGSDTSGSSIQGQRYNADGLPQGSQFQVNSYTTDFQGNPAVAIDSDGDFVVVWDSYGSSSADVFFSVQGQRYNSAGIPQGNQFQVNSYTTNQQRYPAVALDSNGNFVVVWDSYGSSGGDTSNRSIQGQRYNSAGIPQGNQFQVNTYTTGGQSNPAVSLDSDGDFVVVWKSSSAEYTDWSIQGQLYNSAGTPLAGQFQVDTYTTGNQSLPAVSLDNDGDFVVAWDSYGQTTDPDWAIAARLFSLQPTDVSLVLPLQPAAPSLPTIATLLALLTALATLLTALHRRLRPTSSSIP